MTAKASAAPAASRTVASATVIATGPGIVAFTVPLIFRPAAVHTAPVSPQAGSGEASDRLTAPSPSGSTVMSNSRSAGGSTRPAFSMVPPFTVNIVPSTVL